MGLARSFGISSSLDAFKCVASGSWDDHFRDFEDSFDTTQITPNPVQSGSTSQNLQAIQECTNPLALDVMPVTKSYCSGGYRSTGVSAKVQALGVTNSQQNGIPSWFLRLCTSDQTSCTTTMVYTSGIYVQWSKHGLESMGYGHQSHNGSPNMMGL